MGPTTTELTPLRRQGRVAGIAAFALLVTAFTVICSVQVLWQVWAPAKIPTEKPCAAAMQELLLAVDRARSEAAQETLGERAAVGRFRRALEPEWSIRAALDDKCAQNQHLSQGLKLIDWLRYAEEHAIRYEAIDVAHLRRKAAQLATELRAADGPPTGSP